ncbi:RNA exonuclease 1 [Liparis tanakae]|uniref:RNA exonuclease 1 n=1 Tax=Liparis tanakae TaxID=230148 RepID=A0A4Z2FYX7_9TELE|nr:RNA exonuclease 1 [Liparis tanakae]
MLRSTGFFRGIDCPFYPEDSEGQAGSGGCNRPYCHFRHSRQRRPARGAPAAAEGPRRRDLRPGKKGAHFPPLEPSGTGGGAEGGMAAERGPSSATAARPRPPEPRSPDPPTPGARGPEPGAGSPEPGARSQGPGARGRAAADEHSRCDVLRNVNVGRRRGLPERTLLQQLHLYDDVTEQGYDPFNPEVVRPQAQENGTSSDSGDLSGALDLVNRAIEEVRGEVEREKRKLSRIGDEPYDPGQRKKAPPPKAAKSKKKPASHAAYDPGSYQLTAGGYSPTPGCSKYTLDADGAASNSSSTEYVPTAVRKPSSRKHAPPPPPSPPPSPKYSSSKSSPKVKYTLDNCKPSTDMEYDPLSNYTAGIAAKSKTERGGGGVGKEVKADGRKPLKLPLVIDPKKYTFSESDGESSGTEYRPYPLSSLQQRKGHRGAPWSGVAPEGKLHALTPRNQEDSAGDLNSEPFQRPPHPCLVSTAALNPAGAINTRRHAVVPLAGDVVADWVVIAEELEPTHLLQADPDMQSLPRRVAGACHCSAARENRGNPPRKNKEKRDQENKQREGTDPRLWETGPRSRRTWTGFYCFGPGAPSPPTR